MFNLHRSVPAVWTLVSAFALFACESKSDKQVEPRTQAPAGETKETTGNAPADESAAPLDAEAIGKAAGTAATTTDDGIVRIGWARTDVPVRVDGMAFPPAAGLGTWAAFSPVSRGAMVMGDTVVFQDEITPAIDAAFAAGLEVSALHNHFIFDDPPVYFMHIGGHGDAEKLAAGVKSVWDAVKRVRAARKTPATVFPGPIVKPGNLDGKALAAIIGHPAEEKPGVIKFVIERRAAMHGVSFGASMGLTTWAAFTGDDALASIDGDFAMQASEVQRVLRALRAADIHVVALHNHMIGEDPAYYFVHFWGKGPAADLARGFRSVLDAQAK
jgi:hypothetical protein